MSKLEEIQIDKLKLTLVGKIQNMGRMYLLCHSKYDNIRGPLLVYYKSISQGLWRLCLLHEGGRLQKGDDYTATTLVHLKLQVLIDKHIDKVSELKPNKRLKSEEEIMNLLNEQCRKMYTESFKEINNLRSKDETFFKDIYLDEDLPLMNDISLTKYLIKMIKLPYLQKILRSNKVINSEDKLHEEILYNGNVIPQVLRYRLILTINDFLGTHLNIDNELESIGILSGNDLIGRRKIYSVKVFDNYDDGQSFVYKIYIQQYYYELEGVGLKSYYNNIIVVPIKLAREDINGDGINMYGLYNFFVPSGIFTSKPLEYVQQSKNVVSLTKDISNNLKVLDDAKKRGAIDYETYEKLVFKIYQNNRRSVNRFGMFHYRFLGDVWSYLFPQVISNSDRLELSNTIDPNNLILKRIYYIKRSNGTFSLGRFHEYSKETKRYIFQVGFEENQELFKEFLKGKLRTHVLNVKLGDRIKSHGELEKYQLCWLGRSSGELTIGQYLGVDNVKTEFYFKSNVENDDDDGIKKYTLANFKEDTFKSNIYRVSIN